MTVRTLFKRLRQALFYLFLLSIPFNFQAFIAGCMFGKYHNDSISEGIELFTRELDFFNYMDQQAPPGVRVTWPDSSDRWPFYTMQLHTTDWHNQLGLTIPHAWKEDLDQISSIETFVSFIGAVRDVSCHVGQPTEYWVYISSYPMPEWHAWDGAFLELLEYHKWFPLPTNTSFAYVDCANSAFLCHIWQVRDPAFVHLKIDETASVSEEDIDSSAFQSSVESLRPLEVRIFDLGLQEDVSPVPSGIFPSRFEQLKSLTSGNGAYTIVDPIDGLLAKGMREYHNFNKHYYFPACNIDGSFLDYSTEFENFLRKKVARPVGLEDAMDMMNGMAFMAGVVSSVTYYFVANPVSMIWTSLLGQPNEGDSLMHHVEERSLMKMRGGPLGSLGSLVQNLVDWVKGDDESGQTAAVDHSQASKEKERMKKWFPA